MDYLSILYFLFASVLCTCTFMCIYVQHRYMHMEIHVYNSKGMDMLIMRTEP